MTAVKKILCSSLEIKYNTIEGYKEGSCVVQRSLKTINFVIDGLNISIFINEDKLKDMLRKAECKSIACLFVEYTEEMQVFRYNIEINAEEPILVLTLLEREIYLEVNKSKLKEILGVNIDGESTLPEKQQKILGIIKNYIDREKMSPTIREIGELAGLKSPSTVHSYLNRLEKNGYIHRTNGCPRSLRVKENI